MSSRLYLIILILILLVSIQPNIKRTICEITHYHSIESLVLEGVEITNHTLSHVSDDEWYQVSSVLVERIQIMSVVLIFSTNHIPATLAQLEIFAEAHIQSAISQITASIYNFHSNRWIDLFYITSTADTQYTTSISDTPSNFMNETGYVKLQFSYFSGGGAPQTLFLDLSYVAIQVTKPKASFFYTPSIVIVNESVVFNASSSYRVGGYIVSYDWSFGDGTNASGIIITHSFESLGNFTVTLTVTDNDGQKDNVSKTIWVRKPPTPRFHYYPFSPAVNQTVTFNASESTPDGGEITAYLWDFGDGTNGTGIITTHEYHAGGNFTILLTILDSEGLNASMSAVITVVVHDIAISSLTYSFQEVYRGMQVAIVLEVKNEGTAYETFNATVFYGSDNIVLETRTIVDLAPDDVRNITFIWDTRNIIYYIHYQITAEVDRVLYEIDTTDNIAASGAVYVRMIGDTNNDGRVDPLDLGFLGAKWGIFKEDPKYDWQADFNGDGRVDPVDLGLLGSYWGRTKWDDSAQLITHYVTVDMRVFEIITLSNSTITDMTFNQNLKKLSFSVTGPSATIGYCEVTFPQALLGGPYIVTVDGMESSMWLLASNGTHITVKMYYYQSTHTIAITGATVYQGDSVIGLFTLLFLSVDDE